MAWALDLIARFFTDIAQQQRDTAASQARQQAADRFSIAWNRGDVAVPPQLVWSMPRPDGSTASVWPGCTAVLADDGRLLLTFTVPPDCAVTADAVARQADVVRLAARGFFGTRLRVTGVEAVPGRCSMMLAPVNPACDSAGKILAGFDDRCEPVWLPLLGQVTAVAGDDGCVDWIASCLSGVIPTATAAPADAVADALRVGRAVRKTGEPSAPMVVGLQDALSGADQLRGELLGFARRGLVEWNRAPQVDMTAWAVRPTQVIARDGDLYTVERDGTRTPFSPAWCY